MHVSGDYPGTPELIGMICKKDEKVLFFTPSYAYFKHAADYNGNEIVCSDLINSAGYYTIDYADLEKKAKDDKARLLIMCNPHNPSGRIWSEEELRRVGDICLANNMMIISDEIHCDLIRTGLCHTPFAKCYPTSDQIITCMAPSKTFNLAGLMFSNIIIPNQSVREIWEARHYGMENPLSIAAAQAAYESGAEWMEALKQYLDENFAYTRDFFRSPSSASGFPHPGSDLSWLGRYLRLCFAGGKTTFFVCKPGRRSFGRRQYVCAEFRGIHPS